MFNKTGRSGQIMAVWTVPFASIIALICFTETSIASDGCTFIDSTEDKCRGANYIYVEPDKIDKGVYTTSGKRITLPGLQTEVTWYCGSTKERAAWGKPGNQLRVKYHDSGNIQWDVYKCDLSGPKEAGKTCVALLTDPYHCPKSVVGNSSQPCMFEITQSTTRSRSKTTTVKVEGTLRAEVTASKAYADAKASAELKASKSKSVTDVQEFHYEAKRFLLIPAGYVYCSLREGVSIVDRHAPTGFSWDCSSTKFVQAPGGACSASSACSDGVCLPPIVFDVGVSIQAGVGVLSLGLVASFLTLLF